MESHLIVCVTLEHESRTCGEVEEQRCQSRAGCSPSLLGRLRGIDETVVDKAIATKGLAVSIDDDGVCALRDIDRIVDVRACGVEIEDEEIVPTPEGQSLILLMDVILLNMERVEGLHRVDEANHRTVELLQVVVEEICIICEAPLTAGVVVRPAITFAWEVNPFGVTELIPHEVEVSTIHRGSSSETNELIESDSAVGDKRAA